MASTWGVQLNRKFDGLILGGTTAGAASFELSTTPAEFTGAAAWNQANIGTVYNEPVAGAVGGVTAVRSTGRITVTEAGIYRIKFTASASLDAANAAMHFRIYKNGAAFPAIPITSETSTVGSPVASVQTATSNLGPKPVHLEHVAYLQPNDYVSIFVDSASATPNLIVAQAQFTVEQVG